MSSYYNSLSLESQTTRKQEAPSQTRVAARAATAVQALSASLPQQEQSQPSSSANHHNASHKDKSFGFGPLSQEAPSQFPQLPACRTPVVVHSPDMLLDYKNDPDPRFDLGQDGAFGEFRVLFCEMNNCYGRDTLLPALQKKGFKVTFYMGNEYQLFLNDLETSNSAAEKSPARFDVVGFASCSRSLGNDDRFTKEILKAHKLGTGLFIFADNQPLTHQANLVLPEIAGCIVTGDDFCNQTIVYGDPKEPGRFDKNHLVFAGINSLYEGVTLCFPCPVVLPNKTEPEKNRLETIAMSTFDRPLISKIEATDEHGRLIVDVGFTKLGKGQWGGQERYVVNACVWLTNIERRYGKQEPVVAMK